MTPNDFVTLLLNAPNGLGSVVGVEVNAWSLKASTRDDHAAHAVEILAKRKGLKVLRTLTDEGLHIIGLKGFAKS